MAQTQSQNTQEFSHSLPGISEPNTDTTHKQVLDLRDLAIDCEGLPQLMLFNLRAEVPYKHMEVF